MILVVGWTAHSTLFSQSIEQISQLIDQQRLEQAEEEARKLVGQEPTSAHAQAVLGFVLELSGKLDEAKEVYSKAIELNGAYLMPRIQLGVLYARETRYMDCVVTLEPVRESLAEEPEALFQLSRSYFEIGAPQEALKVAETLRKRHSHDGGALLSAGNLLLSKGYAKQATAILKKAAEELPDSFEAHYGLGVAFYQSAEYAEAVKALSLAFKLNPSSERAGVLQAMSLINVGDEAKAAPILQSVLLRNQRNDYACFLLGQIHLKEKRYSESVVLLRKAVDLRPEKPEYHFELVEAYHMNGDSEKALQHAHRLVELFPLHPRSYLNEGMELNLSGEFERAKRSLRQCIELARPGGSAEDVDVWSQAGYYLASILRKEGSFSEAIPVLRKIVERRPEPVALLELSRCYMQSGEPLQAIPLLENIVEVRPGNPEVHFLLGTALANMGDSNRAQQQFEIFEQLKRCETNEELCSGLAAAGSGPDPVSTFADKRRDGTTTDQQHARRQISALSEGPGVHFEDRAAQANILFEHFSGASPQKYMIETFCSGVGLIDYDGDGLLDIYFLNGASNPARTADRSTEHALYRNLGDGTFMDTTKSAGVGGYGNYGSGVAVGDFNNDGWLDLYVTHMGPNVLYLNSGDGTFQDISEEAGVADEHWGASTAFFDYDNDGLLDLFVANYVDYDYDHHPFCGSQERGRSYCDPDHFSGVADKLYRNRGDGTFEDVSQKSGIANSEGKGLGVVMADIDLDGWMDVYVTNDKVRNFLYKNNRDGTFADITFLSLTGYNEEGRAEASMGTDFADFDGDGLLDLFVTNYDMETNALYRNMGKSLFSDDRWVGGVARASIRLLGFGTMFVDYDNDGDRDLFIANGHVLDDAASYQDDVSYAQPNQLLENRGSKFGDVSSLLGKPFAVADVSRGAAIGDLDNDGDIDIVVSNSNQVPRLLINQNGNRNNWILLQLHGHKSNRDGIGAKVRLVVGDKTYYDQATGGGSYLSAHDLRMHFGLADAQIVDEVEVHWPSGIVDLLEGVKANQILVIEEGSFASAGSVQSSRKR